MIQLECEHSAPVFMTLPSTRVDRPDAILLILLATGLIRRAQGWRRHLRRGGLPCRHDNPLHCCIPTPPPNRYFPPELRLPRSSPSPSRPHPVTALSSGRGEPPQRFFLSQSEKEGGEGRVKKKKEERAARGRRRRSVFFLIFFWSRAHARGRSRLSVNEGAGGKRGGGKQNGGGVLAAAAGRQGEGDVGLTLGVGRGANIPPTPNAAPRWGGDPFSSVGSLEGKPPRRAAPFPGSACLVLSLR